MSQSLEIHRDIRKRKLGSFKNKNDSLDALLLDDPTFETTELHDSKLPTKSKKLKLPPKIATKQGVAGQLSLSNLRTVKINQQVDEEVPEVFRLFAPSDKLFDCPVFADQIIQIQKINKQSGYVSPYENVAFLSASESCNNTPELVPAFQRSDTRLALPMHNLFLQTADQMCQFTHHVEKAIQQLQGSTVAHDPKILNLLTTLSNHTNYLGATVFHVLGRASYYRKVWIFHELLKDSGESLPKHHASQQMCVKNEHSSTKDDVSFTGIRLFDFIEWSKEKHRNEILAQKSSQFALAKNFSSVFTPKEPYTSYPSNSFSNNRPLYYETRNQRGNVRLQTNRNFNNRDRENFNRDREPRQPNESRQRELVAELQKEIGGNGSIMDALAPNLVGENRYHSSNYKGKNKDGER